MKITLKLVKQLLENYQSNKSMVAGMSKLAQTESSFTLKENIIVLQQQMKLLDNSIELLTDIEKKYVVKVYKQRCSVSKFARENFICRAQCYRIRDKIFEKLADLMSKMG